MKVLPYCLSMLFPYVMQTHFLIITVMIESLNINVCENARTDRNIIR